MRLRSRLIILVVVAILPILLFGALMLVHNARTQRAIVEHGMRETVRALALALDKEFEAAVAALQALATSPHLEAGDLRAFYEQARLVRDHHPRWQSVVLVHVSGQQVVDLVRPFGVPLPDVRDVDVFRRVVATERPAVSELQQSSVSNSAQITIEVPVVRAGRLYYVLGATIPPDAWSGLLREQRAPADWHAIIFDQRSVAVARSRQSEGAMYVGRPAPPWYIEGSDDAHDGFLKGTTFDGSPVYVAFHRSSISQWTVAFAAPASALDGPARRLLLLAGAAGAALLAAGVAWACLWGQRIEAPVVALARMARALGQGLSVRGGRPSGVREVEIVRRALEAAEVTLRERAAARDALLLSEQRYRDVVESQTDLICRFLPDSTVTFVNEASCRYFDRPREELIGRRFVELVPEEVRNELLQNVAALFAWQPREDVRSREYEVLRPDGTRGWQVWTARLILGADGTAIEAQGIGRDVTEQRLAEQALRDSQEALRRSRDQIQELAGRLLTAQEDERRRISRELHDDVNQKLAALAIALSSVRRSMPPSARATRDEVVRLEGRVAALVEDIRRLSHKLHPPVLLHAGLVAGLRAYCAEFREDTGIEIAFDVTDVTDEALAVPADVALCLYRVAQEALHNIAKHSGAQQARVGLRRAGTSIELSIRDAGSGFERSSADLWPGGLGLVSIEERMRLVQGGVRIVTAPGHGTEVLAQAPLPEHLSEDGRSG